MAHTTFDKLDYLTGRSLKALSSRVFSWDPVLTAITTAPNLGEDGEAAGAFVLNGLMVTAWARFRWGGTGADSGQGTLFLVPPIAEDRDFLVVDENATEYVSRVGIGQMHDASTPANDAIVSCQFDDNFLSSIKFTPSGTNTSLNHVNTTWADGDALSATINYVADPTALHAFLGVGEE